MKAIVFAEPNVVRLAALPDPEPPSGWVRVKVRAAAICMTDFEVLRGRIAAQYPLTPGHEWSGVVDRVGSPTDEAWLGRRVTGDNEITCLKCAYCRRGEWRRCAEYRQIGFAAPGAYAEYLLVPAWNLHPLADSVSFEQGALLEPLGVGIAVATAGGARIAASAAVLGAGPIGLNCLAALRASGARRILCLDRRPTRLRLASAWGAARVCADFDELRSLSGQLHPDGTDIVVDATGSPQLLEAAISLARFGGTVVLAGYFGGCGTTFAPDAVHERNVRVIGAGNNSGFTGIAALAAGDGVLQTESIITHRFRLDDFAEALCPDQIGQSGYIKGLFLL